MPPSPRMLSQKHKKNLQILPILSIRGSDTNGKWQKILFNNDIIEKDFSRLYLVKLIQEDG
jgi:hypothetical protein